MEHTTAWRNTLLYGGTQCGLQEHATAWEEHTTAWRKTLLYGGTQCGLQEHATAWEEHTTAWRGTILSGGTLWSTGTHYGLGGTYYRLEDLSLLQRRININITCGYYKVHQGAK